MSPPHRPALPSDKPSRPATDSPADTSSYEFKFALNVTPSTFPANSIMSLDDGPIVPSNDGLLTAPDGSTLTPYSVLELSEKSATTQRRQRKRTHDRGGDWVPRPPNPFILFRCWYTARVHKPGSHDSSEGSLSSHCGKEWANLGVTQRRIFEEAAKIEKVKHAERYPNYRYKPIHKKGKKAAAAAAALATTQIYSYDLSPEEEEYAPPAQKHRAVPSPLVPPPALSNWSAPSTSQTPPLRHPIPQLPSSMHSTLARHRRSSSVPLPADMEMMDLSMRPIELPAVPFLALAGQDIPPRRSRGNSLGLSNWSFPRPSEALQAWNYPEQVQPFNYTAMRTSLVGLQSVPNSPRPRRNMLPTPQPTQYAYTAQEQFYNSFAELSSEVQWTNPNPFASSQSSSNGHDVAPGASPLNPYVQTLVHDSSSSSSSAPSPPADAISPLDHAPHQNPQIMTPSDMPSHREPAMPLPFDLNIFKSSAPSVREVNFGLPVDDMGRTRGLSILDADHIDMMHQNSDYIHALRTEGFVGEIPTHDHMMVNYIQDGEQR